MKILLFSDLHARKLYRNLSSEEVLQDIINVIHEIQVIAKNNKVEAIIFLGDLFDRKGSVSVELLDRIYKALRPFADNHFIMIQGNHDISGRYSILEPFKELGEAIDYPCVFDLGGKKFFAYPHYDGDYLYEEADVMIGHLALAEGVLGDTDIKLKKELSIKEIEDFYDLILLGHYHKFQKIREKTWYIGSALQLSFGEAGQKKYCVILDTDDLSLEWIELTSARQYIIMVFANQPEMTQDEMKGYFDSEQEILSHAIVKIILAENQVIDNSWIPEGTEYFIERFSHRDTKTRLSNSNLKNMNGMMKEYIKISNSPLDHDKLLELGKEIITRAKDIE